MKNLPSFLTAVCCDFSHSIVLRQTETLRVLKWPVRGQAMESFILTDKQQPQHNQTNKK